MLTFITWSSMIASTLLFHFDKSLTGLLFALSLIIIASTALCVDIAADKVIKYLKKVASNEHTK